jgi:hypothetical protein
MTPNGTTHICSNEKYEKYIQIVNCDVFKIFGRNAQYFKVWNQMLNCWDGICLITFEQYCKNHKFKSVEVLNDLH